MRSNKLFWFLIIGYWLFIHPVQIYASYMLPYPSTMPGNKIYTFTRIVDNLKAYWYVGDIAQVKYHLMLSDKYLVEAKTLFEYKQYLLAQDALVRSDMHFKLLSNALSNGKKHGKDMGEIGHAVADAAVAHITLLNSLQTILPESFEWKPEKGDTTNIPVYEHISEAKQIRMSVKQMLQR